jgi:alpha-glucosidase
MSKSSFFCLSSLLTGLLWASLGLTMSAQPIEISSPDSSIRIEVQLTDRIYYRVVVDEQPVMWYSPLSMTLIGGRVLGQAPKLVSQRTRSVRATIEPVWGIRSEIKDHYEELTLAFDNKFSVIFRAYDQGVAYRFRSELPGEIRVKEEEVAYRFLEDHGVVSHIVGDFQTSYEKLYTQQSISQMVDSEFVSLPLIIDQGNLKLAITESDVVAYPGLYLKRQGNNNRRELVGLLPAYPEAWEIGGWSQFNLRVTERRDYLAKTEGTRLFPWRVMVVAREDRELADNDLVYQLARPSQIQTDWIQPGKVAWDWWNAWNLTNVDFETGVNDQTYRHYIDFAAEHDIPYIIMDEGWSDPFDLFLMKPGVDVKALIDYATQRDVKVILWCVWHTLDRQMTEALDQFEAWGVAGIKVDFIDRDDQLAIEFYERLAHEAAKRKLLVDYHGCSKPTGLHRTYPNVINYEAVRGNEYNKFSTGETPGHNVDIAYTRMLAGPMDYTPGAMRNSTQGHFSTNNENPMSYGTRCHQLGMYVVYYSPLQMLCDAPTAYERYPDILDFLSRVPVSWDETIALDGQLGEYLVMARRQGDTWWIGALGDWQERELTVDLSFLGEGTHQATLYLDGLNAHRQAEDYRVETRSVNAETPLRITLKPGGGMSGWITRE